MPVEDLSTLHYPIGDVLNLPASPQSTEHFRLTEEQVRFFHENGYLQGIRMLSDEQVDVLRGELADLMNPGHPGHHLFYEFHRDESQDASMVLFHALGAWRVASGFHDVLWNPRFTLPASQLLGGAVRFWHDQLFCKPARHGGIVAWHQDYSYWTRTKPQAHLTCWIGLDDSTRDNGCLQYVPGSHRWTDLPKTGLTGDMNSIQAVLTQEQKQLFHPLAIELKKGEASFHHPRLIHGSYANRTDRPRRATVINVMLDGVKSNSNEPLLPGIPVIPAGQSVSGQFFPLLFHPEVLRPGQPETVFP